MHPLDDADAAHPPGVQPDPHQPDFLVYGDATGYAEFTRGPAGIQIYGFASHVSGQGHGRRILGLLRGHYGHLTAVDPGTPEGSPEALGFWRHMQACGLVDALVTEDLVPIDPADPAWFVPPRPTQDLAA